MSEKQLYSDLNIQSTGAPSIQNVIAEALDAFSSRESKLQRYPDFTASKYLPSDFHISDQSDAQKLMPIRFTLESSSPNGGGTTTIRWNANGDEVVSESSGTAFGGEMAAANVFYPVTEIKGQPPNPMQETSLNYRDGSQASVITNGGGPGGIDLTFRVQDANNDEILIQRIPAGMGDGQQWRIEINGQVLNVPADWLKNISVTGSGLNTEIVLQTKNGPVVLSKDSADAYNQVMNLIQANK